MEGDETRQDGRVGTVALCFSYFTLRNAFDGSAGTRWSSLSNADPQWVQVNLGSVQTVCKITLQWEAAHAGTLQCDVSKAYLPCAAILLYEWTECAAACCMVVCTGDCNRNNYDDDDSGDDAADEEQGAVGGSGIVPPPLTASPTVSPMATPVATATPVAHPIRRVAVTAAQAGS